MDMPAAPSSPESAPKQVSRFEASLLRILRFFFRQVPDEEAIPLVRAQRDRPSCLSAAAVHLVRDTLSKGCILYLVRAGGWKKDRFLRKGEPKVGRLWERSASAELALEFSPHSLEFLIWLTANRPGQTKPVWQAPAEQLTPGDRLLLFLAYEALREEQDLAPALRSSPCFSDHALCQLAFPDDFASEPANDALSFDGWLAGSGGLILEAMQPYLENRWLEIEREKGQLGDWERMRSQGQAEFRVLGLFLDAAAKANRRDLSRFLLGVLAQVLATPDMTPAFWTGGLQGGGPPRLADRLDAQRSAFAVLRQVERFRQWELQARASGFMDEDYAASKFWLGEWERANEMARSGGKRKDDARPPDASIIPNRAEHVLRMLEPLRTNDN